MVIFPDTKIQRYRHCTSSTFFPCIYQYLQRYGKKVDDVHCRYLCRKHGDLTKHKETAKSTGNLPTTQRQFCNFKINTVWKYSAHEDFMFVRVWQRCQELPFNLSTRIILNLTFPNNNITIIYFNNYCILNFELYWRIQGGGVKKFY